MKNTIKKSLYSISIFITFMAHALHGMATQSQIKSAAAVKANTLETGAAMSSPAPSGVTLNSNARVDQLLAMKWQGACGNSECSMNNRLLSHLLLALNDIALNRKSEKLQTILSAIKNQLNPENPQRCVDPRKHVIGRLNGCDVLKSTLEKSESLSSSQSTQQDALTILKLLRPYGSTGNNELSSSSSSAAAQSAQAKSPTAMQINIRPSVKKLLGKEKAIITNITYNIFNGPSSHNTFNDTSAQSPQVELPTARQISMRSSIKKLLGKKPKNKTEKEALQEALKEASSARHVVVAEKRKK